MPGLYGNISDNRQGFQPDSSSMLSTLRYGCATIAESYSDEGISMGCVHLGTGGQRALYRSDQAAVFFYGYLTRPSLPPGSDGVDPSAAAHLVHDRYLSCGRRILQEIGGAFALAIWDVRSQTLLLASDRLGLRPLYYAEYNGAFRFASEVKGILSDPTFPRRLNKQAVADFTQINFIMGDQTLFEHILLLPPASVLTYQHGKVSVSTYWNIPFPTSYPNRPDRYYDDLIYEAMRTSVKRMVRPGLRYGVSLSGGLDSRWIAALLSDCQPESLVFTLCTPGSDDTPSAVAVADATGLKHYLWEVSPTFAADLGETYVYATDGMDNLWHMEEFPLTLRVGQYADVSVGGFLGDGLFGYEINPVSAILSKQAVTRYRRWRISESWPAPSLMAQVFRGDLGEELSQLSMQSLRDAYRQSPVKWGFQAIQYYDLRQAERRYANIAQLSKLSFVDMYHPIADEDLVMAALQLPPSQLMFERAYRRSMATHLPDMAKIPWTFTLTRPTISVLGVMAKKAAQLTLGKYLRHTRWGKHPLIRQRQYYVNHTQWSRTVLRPFIEKTLLCPEVEALGVFNMQGLKKIIQDHFDGRMTATHFLGAALTLSLWSRMFFLPSVPVRPGALPLSACLWGNSQ